MTPEAPTAFAKQTLGRVACYQDAGITRQQPFRLRKPNPLAIAFSKPAGSEVAPATGTPAQAHLRVSQATSAAHGALADAVSVKASSRRRNL